MRDYFTSLLFLSEFIELRLQRHPFMERSAIKDTAKSPTRSFTEGHAKKQKTLAMYCKGFSILI
jgi:hypothetical protein